MIDQPRETEPLLIDCTTAAKMLSISERTLWAYTKEGKIPHVRLGRRVLYDPEDLRAWRDQNKRHAISDSNR